MSLLDLADQLRARVLQGAANGLNQAAADILQDIQTHVQVKTGALRDSYAIVQQATPDNLTVVVDSPLAAPGQYGADQYPPVPTQIPPERNRALQQGDPLFPTPTETEKLEALVQQRLREGIQQALTT